MLHIVTGKINSGKTTKLLNIYNQKRVGDGFISIKNMDGKNVHSYDILKLSSKQKKAFVVNEKYLKKGSEVACVIGPYHFLKETFLMIENEIRKMIHHQISPIYLDEIGLLELENQCFHQIFTELLKSDLDVYVVIREDLIKPIIKKYKIKTYKILS